jgi:hypothetical protein
MSLDERWHLLSFDLRLSSRYHAERRRFFDRLHTLVAGFSAVLGSATVVALMTDMSNGKEIAVLLSFLVAVGAAMDSVMGFARKAADYGELARRFIALERAFLAIEPATEAEYVKLVSERRAIEADEPPSMPLLVRRCHRELMRHDGYPADQWPAMTWLARCFAQLVPHT